MLSKNTETLCPHQAKDFEKKDRKSTQPSLNLWENRVSRQTDQNSPAEILF